MFDSESLARVTGWVGELARTPHTVDGHAARAATVRRIRDWADAALARTVGRAQRLATTAQRRAIRTMYRTCAVPGCDVTVDRCDIHHALPYEQGGHTNLDNLVPVCWRHHHLVHEGGWRLLIDAQRTITIVRPDGTTHTQTPHPTITRCRLQRRSREGFTSGATGFG